MPTNKQSGLGLLELMLALTLLSITATLIGQTLSQLSRYGSALSSATKTLADTGLIRSQLRNSVSNAAPLSGPGGGLKGDTNTISYYYSSTFPSHMESPLIKGRLELRNHFGWQLNFEPMEGLYQTPYQGEGTARFRYLDYQQQWHTQWPPLQQLSPNEGLTTVRQRLPQAIQIAVTSQGQIKSFLTLFVQGQLYAPLSSAGLE